MFDSPGPSGGTDRDPSVCPELPGAVTRTGRAVLAPPFEQNGRSRGMSLMNSTTTGYDFEVLVSLFLLALLKPLVTNQ